MSTPYDKYFEAYDDFHKRNPHYIGAMNIKGLDVTEEDLDKRGEPKDKSKFTEEDMSALRYVWITKKIENRLNEMREYVLGGEANEPFMMFRPSQLGERVQDGFSTYRDVKWKKLKTPSEKFDSLLAYTYVLTTFDAWMNCTLGGFDDMAEQLGEFWRHLLEYDDETLGIDAEYTRPGVIQLLDNLQWAFGNAFDVEFEYE